MKKYILSMLLLSGIAACNSKEENKTGTTTAANITLPYEAGYTTDFNNNVSDSDLRLAFNSYKYWETGDLKALRSTMGDSMAINMPDGFKFNGLTDSLMKIRILYRDSLSSISLKWMCG